MASYDVILEKIDNIPDTTSYSDFIKIQSKITNDISFSDLSVNQKARLFELLEKVKRVIMNKNAKSLPITIMPIVYFDNIKEKSKRGIDPSETLTAKYGLQAIKNARDLCMSFLNHTSPENLQMTIYNELTALLMEDHNKLAVRNAIISKYEQMEKLGFVDKELKDAYVDELLRNLEEKVWK